MRLLLVEDDVPLAEELLLRLRGEFAVDWVVDARDAIARTASTDYDVVVLDLGLPGADGLDVLMHWRQAGLRFPVLVLSARASFAERIEGLRVGADDYLTKPFHGDELLLRLSALLRRSHGLNPQEMLTVGGVTLDERRREVRVGEERMPLAATEYRLLRYLMLNRGRVLSRGKLEEHLYDGEVERSSNVLEVHVNRLRRKIGAESIETLRGQGYRYRGVEEHEEK